MSSRRRKREMWMWWLTPTCSTLLYYTGKRERRRRRKKKPKREQKITREWRVYVYNISLSSTWVVGGWSPFSLCRFFFLKPSKKNEHAQLSFRLMNSELLTLSLLRASAAMIILITHSTNEKNTKKKKTVGRWEWVWPVHCYYIKRWIGSEKGMRA